MIERLGIIRLSAIGDVIHAMPLAMALRRRYPQARITWVVQKQAAPLLEGHPAIDELLIFPRRADWAGWKQFRRRILACRFDATVDPQGNIKSGIVARLSGSRIRCGLALRDCKEWPNWFFNNRHGPHPSGLHGVDRAFAAGVPLDAGQGPDAGPDVGVDEWGLHATDEERAAWRQRCRDHGANPDAPLISIGLSNPADARSWFTEHWVALMPLLRAHGVPVVLNGMADVADVARQLHGPGVVDLVGSDDLRGLLAQFESMARYPASALVTTDSGPAHVAAAVGLPVVCLSGSQDPARTGPRSGSIALTAWEGLACAPCIERECVLRPPTRDCMRNLLPVRVINALAALRPGELAD